MVRLGAVVADSEARSTCAGVRLQSVTAPLMATLLSEVMGTLRSALADPAALQAPAVDPKAVLEGGRMPPEDFPVCQEDLRLAAAEGVRVFFSINGWQAVAAGLGDLAVAVAVAALEEVETLLSAVAWPGLAVSAGEKVPVPMVPGNPEAAGLLSVAPSSLRTASVRSLE